MPNPDLSKKITEIGDLVAVASRQAQNGEVPDSRVIEEKTRVLCAEIQALSQADRDSIQSPFLLLLSEMDDFYALLQQKHAEILTQLKNLNPQHKASDAYSKAANIKPDKKP